MAKPKECAHEPCDCRALPTSDYCSEACERADARASSECSCGHPGCAASEKSADAERRASR